MWGLPSFFRRTGRLRFGRGECPASGRPCTAAAWRTVVEQEGDRTRRHVCDYCGSVFHLSPGERLSLRYEGRKPQVECPTCQEHREVEEESKASRG